MQQRQPIIIVGGSARAAAGSAIRAGLDPWCADFFADADLAALCPVRCVTGPHYPHGLQAAMRDAPPGPWLYTGALENRPELLEKLGRERPLWGIGGHALELARAPREWARLLHRAGLPAPACTFETPVGHPERAWLLKPIKSGGGLRIQPWTGQEVGTDWFLQEYIDGLPCAAIFVGDGHAATLLGTTRQLVGIDWLHAPPYQYCGSVGPLELEAGTQIMLRQIGAVLTKGCGLRGIFGIDFVLQDGVPWPVEINPRYTASVEVLEHALGIAPLAVHRAVFKNGLQLEGTGNHLQLAETPRRAERIVGKVILYADRATSFPEEGPWQTLLNFPAAVQQIPEYADIPHPGAPLFPGRPIFTCLASGSSPTEVLNLLARRVALVEEVFARQPAFPT